MANQITPNPSVPSQVVADGLKFPKFINNLGIIPTSYKDSMSYYECLAWLCKYLEETVIPSVNQNGNAVQELQNLYIELNSYVAHYFDTLDVQEEINNKLDEMASSGVLEDVLSVYFTDLQNTYTERYDQILNLVNFVQSEVQSASSGSPAGVYDTVSALETADPDHSKIYVVNEDGKWYYYNTTNSEWTAGGDYQASVNLDTVDRLSDNVEKIISNETDFMFNDKFYYNFEFVAKKRQDMGNIVDTLGANYCATVNYYELPPLTKATSLTIKKPLTDRGFTIQIFDENKTYLSGLSYNTRLDKEDTEKTLTLTSQTKYIRVGVYTDSGTTLTPVEANNSIEISCNLVELTNIKNLINTNETDSEAKFGDWNIIQYTTDSNNPSNKEVVTNIPQGTNILIKFKNYTGSYLQSLRVLFYKSDNTYDVSPATFSPNTQILYKAQNNYVKYLIQCFKTQTETATVSLEVLTDKNGGITESIIDNKNSRIYHVEQDGSGDFTTIKEAVEEATKYFDSIVYIGSGTYDLIEELGDTYLENNNDTEMGLFLKNRIHLICSSDSKIECIYTGSRAHTIDSLSAFNAGVYGFTLENANIEVGNCRYCVHDERNDNTDQYNNYYINCRMKNTGYTGGARSQCIGGGLGGNGHIIIKDCIFENPNVTNYGVVSYHNTWLTGGDGESFIDVSGCYFKGSTTFRAGNFGEATTITKCLIHGNSMGLEPFVSDEVEGASTNMEIIKYCNEIRS